MSKQLEQRLRVITNMNDAQAQSGKTTPTKQHEIESSFTATMNKLPTEKKDIPFSFKTQKYQNLKKDLLSSSSMKPADDIKKFIEVTKQRGYDFFSPESIEDWKSKFGSVTAIDIMNWAEADKVLFMASVMNPSDPDHEKNRLRFVSEFKSDESKVKDFFIQYHNSVNGKDNMPLRDTAYESRCLSMGTISSNHAGFEYRTLCDLMKSKWSCCGYYLDDQYKGKFLSDYCIALTAS